MHEHAFLHPEWCRLDKNGAILRGDRTGNFFRTMCYNSPGYHRHLLDTIREICAYDIDGLFCDCMHFFPCHCAQCTQDMLARGIDIEDENAVEAFSREVMLRVRGKFSRLPGRSGICILMACPYTRTVGWIRTSSWNACPAAAGAMIFSGHPPLMRAACKGLFCM